MTCISCDKDSTIIYNTLPYCEVCFNLMKNMFSAYAKEHDKYIDKTFVKPVKIINNVYIGSLNSVGMELNELNITHIIIAGNNLRNNNHINFNCLELSIDDSFEQEIISYVELSHNFIKNNKNSNILIHCYSGISRSGSILIGHIMLENNWNYKKTYEYVKNIYPNIFPNENFQKQLIDFEKKINL